MFGINVFGQFHGMTALDLFFKNLQPSLFEEGLFFIIDIINWKDVSDECPSFVHGYLIGGGEMVLGLKWINYSVGFELMGFGPCSFYVVDFERIADFVNLLIFIGNGFHVGG